MRSSFAVCFLAVLFCVVVCVFANAEVNLEEAKAAVADAEKTVTTVRERAQKEFDDAQSVLDKVQSSKSAADIAASKSQAAAKDNAKAKAISANIKSLSDEVAASYLAVQQKLDTAVKSLNTLLSKAKELDDKPDIQITANTDQANDYTETNGEAAALKAQATELNGRITNAVQPIAGFDSKADDMVKKAKEAQLKDAHVSAIVAVATIETILGNAATTIGQIEGKKNEVSGIAGEMQKDCATELSQSNKVIKEQCQIANDALKSAQAAVQNAKDAKTAIQTQKDTADAALTKVKAENQEVSDAKNEVTAAEASVGAAELIIPKLNDALQIAKDSLTSATDAKQKLQTALSTTTSATRPEQSVTNLQLKELQDSVRTAVNTIQTMVEEADGTLQETTNNKEAVHNIVEEMKKLSTTEFIEANQNIKVLYNKADDALTDATGAVQKAEKAKRDMTEQKEKADDALSRVATAKDVETAQKEVNTTNACVNQVKQFAATLKSTLQTAKDSVTTAKTLKQKLMTALSTTTTEQNTQQTKEKEETNLPVADSTDSHQKDPTIQPRSKDPPSPSKNTSEEIKQTLINGAQNVPTTALTGGKSPAPDAKNDSAMTVSVPLLVALIASAVWQ